MTATQPDPAAILAALTDEVRAHAAAGRQPPKSLIAVILDLRRQLEVLDRHRAAHPLAYARLWDRLIVPARKCRLILG